MKVFDKLLIAATALIWAINLTFTLIAVWDIAHYETPTWRNLK